MRPRRCKLRGLVFSGLALLGANRIALGQSSSKPEGAPELLLPIGARSLSMGQAAVASAIGTDALWWNPALVARGPREVGLQIAKTFLIDADAEVAVVYPVQDVGTVALSVRYINEGQQEVDTAGIAVGSLVRTALVYSATFAAPFGPRFAAGVTAKLLSISVPCTGQCLDTPSSQQTSGLDLGAQYFVTGDSTLVVGAAVRNVGFKLQVNDTPQADAIPARGDFGFQYTPKWSTLPKEARLHIAADVLTVVGGGSPGYRVGGELSWLDRYQGRVGYVQNGPTGSGPTFGVGVSTGRFQIDFSQMLSDLSGSGSPPSYLTLRYTF